MGKTGHRKPGPKTKRVRKLTKQVKSLKGKITVLKHEKQADAKLIENLVNDNQTHTQEIERLQLVNTEKEEHNTQLLADLEPLQFEIFAMRKRNQKLQRELREKPDDQALITTLREQNQVMRSKISALKSQLHAAKLSNSEEAARFRVYISKLQNEIHEVKRRGKAEKTSRKHHHEKRSRKDHEKSKAQVKKHSSRPRKSLSGIMNTCPDMARHLVGFE